MLTPVLKESKSGTRKRSAGRLFQRTMDMGKTDLCVNLSVRKRVHVYTSGCSKNDGSGMADFVKHSEARVDTSVFQG